MTGRNHMEKTQIFWGTGKVGRTILELWKKINMAPDFFCDNSRVLWGTKIEGIRVLSPEQVYELSGKAAVFITCSYYMEVKKQLLEHGMPKESIIVADSVSTELYRLSDDLYTLFLKEIQMKKGMYQCLIDLSNGMVLGGVERWSYSLAKTLAGMGINGAYLMPADCNKSVMDSTIPNLIIERSDKISIIDTIKSIAEICPKVIICNFPFDIMIGACIVKRYINTDLKIIAVVHNDEEIYYRTLVTWEKYVDICLTISTKIKNTLLDRGFDASKLKDLYWKIPGIRRYCRQYSVEGQPLKIGYAGRVDVTQKRIDLLLRVSEGLDANGIAYIIHIAGTGEYEDELRKEIKKRKLENKIKLVGMIKHKDIMDFWSKQDICISCSEWEGHSISHSEAMAAGAVLVITDTSGARDDVEEGINGFVVKIGDVEALVNRITYLYHHREALSSMGDYSIEKIDARNKYMEPGSYWRELLN